MFCSILNPNIFLRLLVLTSTGLSISCSDNADQTLASKTDQGDTGLNTKKADSLDQGVGPLINDSLTSDQNSSMHSDAQTELPLTWGPCDSSKWVRPKPPASVECTYVNVPLDYRNPKDGQTFKLLVARQKSKVFPNGKAIAFVAGGPGDSSVELSGTMPLLLPELNDNFDLIYVDQRGTGGSDFLGCSTYPKDKATSTACFKDVQNKPLQYYFTIHAAYDLDEVRKRLGYEKLSFRGGSYGTRVALEYMRQFPEQTASVVLDGIAPPDYDYYSMLATYSDRGIQMLIRDCEKDPKCKEISPDLANDLVTRRNNLKDTPRPLKVEGYSQIIFEGEASYLLILNATVGVTKTRYKLPRAIHQAVLGDNKLWNQLMSDLYGIEISDAPAGSSAQKSSYLAPVVSIQNIFHLPFPRLSTANGNADGMHFLVSCNEDMPNVNIDALVALEKQQSWSLNQGNICAQEICPVWMLPEANVDIKPVQSSAKVLLLSGELDLITPPEWGTRAAQTLPNSTHLIIPYSTHSTIANSTSCVSKLMTAFYQADGDMTKVDTSCIDQLTIPGW